MPRLPCEWTESDWRLVANAIARTHWHDDVDDAQAELLLEGIAERFGTSPAELVRD